LAHCAAALNQNAALAGPADDAARLSRMRFETGRDVFLDVLVAQQNRAAARQALAQSYMACGRRRDIAFKAVGGGWENAPRV
jgi:outer membrane protein TolC